MISRTSVCLLSSLALAMTAASAQDFGAPTRATPGAATTAPDGQPAEEPLPLDRHTFDPPVPATVRKTSGTVLRGLWLGIEPTGIRFQLETGGQFTYENKTVRTVRTFDGKLTYNPDKDELNQAVAAARLAYPKVVRQTPVAGAVPTAGGTAPGLPPGIRPSFPGRPFPGPGPSGGTGSPFAGSPFQPGGPAGGHQSLPGAPSSIPHPHNQVQQQVADIHRRQQESLHAAQQNASHAFEQMRERLDSTTHPRWEGGRQIFEYEYRCRHCGHSFRTADGSLGGTPCPKCQPNQARPAAVAAAGSHSAGGSSWGTFRVPRGLGKLIGMAIGGVVLLVGGVLAAMRSAGERPQRRKRKAASGQSSRSNEYEDY